MKSASSYKIYLCGDLYIYPELGQAKREEDTIRLGPVNMKVLTTLLDRSGELVSRTELFETVWKNQIVNDDTLTRSISDLRSQLGKLSKHCQLIETIPKRGYRWVTEIEILSDKPEQKSLSENLPKTRKPSILPSTKTKQRLPKNLWNKLKTTLQLLLLLFISVLTGSWIFNQLLQPDLPQIAILPIQISTVPSSLTEAENRISTIIDETLQNQLLKNKTLKILAKSLTAEKGIKPYPYLYREYGIRWIIEGRTKINDDEVYIYLAVVDAHTAMVHHAKIKHMKNHPEQIQRFCLEFIKEVITLI